MVTSFHAPSLEVCIWFPLTFHWPALGYLATANCKEAGKCVLAVDSGRRGKRGIRSGEEIVCHSHTSVVFALALGESCIYSTGIY